MRRHIAALAISGLAILLGATLSGLPFFISAEESLRDLRIRYFAPVTTVHPALVLVALDEETMQSLPYRSPIPRDFLANLHSRLAAAAPRLIAYDLFFKDVTFASADHNLLRALKAMPPYAVSLGRDGPNETVIEDPPREEFQVVLAGWGLADLPLNPFSQVVRRAQLTYPTPSGPRPTFVGMLFSALTDASTSVTLAGPLLPASFTSFGSRDPSEAMVIRYAQPPTGDESRPVIPTFSAKLVADGIIPIDWFKDKIVMVGATFDDAQDAFITPYYSSLYGFRRMPGVEVHAQILSSLLTGQRFLLFSKDHGIILLMVLVILTVAMTVYGRAWRLFVTPVVIPMVAFSLSIWFMRSAIFMPIGMPLVGIFLGYVFGLTWRTLSEGRQRRWLKSTFSKYVSPAVVDDLVRHPERVRVGGERIMITCLFSDIANFTTMSERLAPEVVVSFLNDYLGTLSQAILDQRGTIDKYEGDSIVAFFGAPIPVNNHAQRAVLAAIAMQKSNESLCERWKSIVGQEVITRVGIHSGEAVVGNIGSDLRFDYTAIGDTVNIASRLEGVNKEYGTRVIMSEATRALLDGTITSRALGNARLKGKTQDLPIYEAIYPLV